MTRSMHSRQRSQLSMPWLNCGVPGASSPLSCSVTVSESTQRHAWLACFRLMMRLRLVAERGRLTQTLSEDGAMGAVFAAEEVVAAEVARSEGIISIAAYNGPEHFVISGRRPAVASALTRLEASGVRVKPLRVPYAAHSQLVEPILPAFQQVLDTVRFKPLRTAFVSNVSGASARTRGNWLSQLLAHPHAGTGTLRLSDADAGRTGHHAFRRDRSAPGAARHGCRMHPGGRRRVAALAAPRPGRLVRPAREPPAPLCRRRRCRLERLRSRISAPTASRCRPIPSAEAGTGWMSWGSAQQRQSLLRIVGRVSQRRCAVKRSRARLT